MINQQGSNMNTQQQLSQNQNWYGGPQPGQSQQRMMNPGQQQQRQMNPQTSPRASMMMNAVQQNQQAPSQQQQQIYPNQQQQIRFTSTNWSGNSQQQQQQRLPMLRGNPGQMNQMNTVRFINTQNNSGLMMNSQNDPTTQEMFYQQSDYVQMSQMNQQPELTPQEVLSKFVDDL